MLKQYVILTNSIAELKKSNIPMQDRLRLEVKLIQTKRLLLQDEVGTSLRGVSSSEAEFRELFYHIQLVCHSDHAAREAALVSSRLDRLMENLKHSQLEEHRTAQATVSYSRHEEARPRSFEPCYS